MSHRSRKTSSPQLQGKPRLLLLLDCQAGVCRWPVQADASVVGGQLFCGRGANPRFAIVPGIKPWTRSRYRGTYYMDE